MQKRFAGSYLMLVGLPLILIIVLLNYGQHRFGMLPSQTQLTVGESGDGRTFHVLTLILQIAVILVVARLCGAIARRLGQPLVVGEMAGGILLGPSVFGAVAPKISTYVFPVQSLDYLNALSQVGLLLFMFMIGLEMDARLLRGAKKTALLTSHASIVVPFALGTALALFFFEFAPPPGTRRFLGYALFMGIAMSITAFPVLARIVQERGLAGSRLGAVALACAAVDDVTAWCILAVVVMIVRSGSLGTSILPMLGGVVVFVGVMLLMLRPLMRWIFERRKATLDASNDLVAFLLIFALASAWITQKIGMHVLFGAFLAGAIVPVEYPQIRALIDRLEAVTVVFLLPLFFAFTGLRTRIGLLDSPDLWMKAILVIAIAVVGKLGAATLAARAGGMNWRDAGAIGALMNTRGLMELVVLNIGLDIGVIPPTLFAMMVLMALVTTIMTAPLLNSILRGPRVA